MLANEAAQNATKLRVRRTVGLSVIDKLAKMNSTVCLYIRLRSTEVGLIHRKVY